MQVTLLQLSDLSHSPGRFVPFCRAPLVLSILDRPGQSAGALRNLRGYHLLSLLIGKIRSTQVKRLSILSLLVGTACTISSVWAHPKATGGDAPLAARIHQVFGRLPLRFEENRGQTDSRVRFLSRNSGHVVFLTSNEAVFSLRPSSGSLGRRAPGHARLGGVGSGPSAEKGPVTGKVVAPVIVRMKMVGANATPRVKGMEELAGRVNYLVGNDPSAWRTQIRTYGKVRYEEVYPGISLFFYGNQRQLEYDFVVAPGADPRRVRLLFEGASRLRLDGEGNLVLSTAAGEILQRRPIIYQSVGGSRKQVAGHYLLEEGNQVGFEIGAYDRGRPLFIDPVFVYSTYFGATDYDAALDIAVDDSGSAYITGVVGSTDFPTTPGSFQAPGAGGFVSKFTPAGDALVYSALIQFSGLALAVDSAGNAWVESAAGNLLKLNASGSALLDSQVIGGEIVALALDDQDNLYLTGITDFRFSPTPGAFQETFGGGDSDGFVMKLDASGALLYASFLGGSGSEIPFSVAVDGAGNAYIGGLVYSFDFPLVNPLQPQIGGSSDAFVSKVNPAGSALVYSTFLGGGTSDEGHAIAVDAAGAAYLTGVTVAGDFPTTPGAFQTSFVGGYDSFLSKISPGGSLEYSTYFGAGVIGFGSDDEAWDIAVDASGNAIITGRTDSSNLAVTPDAPQPTLGGGLFDAFVTKFDTTGTGLVYSTYLGGATTDEAWGIDLDPSGAAYIAGETSSFDFPTVNPFQGTIGGGFNREDGFLTKISDTGPPPVSADLAVSISDSPDPVPMGATLTYTLLVPNNGPDGATSVELTVRLDPVLAFVSATSSQGSCGGPDPFNMILCQLGSLDAGVTAAVTIDSIAPMSLGSLGTDAFVSADQFDPNVNNNSDREVTDLTASGFDLTVQVRGKGRVTSNPAGISCPGDCSQTFGSGTLVALTAQPDPGWRLRRWDGACAGTPIFQPCVVEMSADRQVKAEFRRRRR